MKQFTLFPLSHFKLKFYGAAISLISLIIIVIEKFVSLFKTDIFSLIQQKQLLYIFVAIGLFLIAFSKQKIDDDRVQLIRGRTAQNAFSFLLAILIGFSFVSTVSSHSINLSGSDVILFVILGLVFYLIVFNLALHFEYAALRRNNDAISNIKSNKIFYLGYLTLALIIALILFTIFKT